MQLLIPYYYFYNQMLQRTISTCFLVLLLAHGSGQTLYQKDFDHYWKTVKENFAYFDRQKTNWEKVKNLYQPWADSCSTMNSFIRLLETANNELYNGHVFLNTNTSSSNRLIPSGADLKLIYKDGKFIIDEIREGFNAELCGLQRGMTILAFNDQPISTAIIPFLPRSVSSYDNDMYEYAANMLLAGTHDRKRKISVSVKGTSKDFYPDDTPVKTGSSPITLLSSKKLDHNIGYIRINNSLGNSGLIKEFDEALDNLLTTDGMILDLRETPSGGTTTIARAIMGRFTDKEQPYQKHIYTAEEIETGIRRSTLELVSPRQKVYTRPVVVLVGYWTGSMGEGIAIGFDAMKRATIAGTKMAGLLGEIYTFETPEKKIPFSFPCVQLQHINGQPREEFIPAIRAADPGKIITTAIKILTD